VLPYNDVEALEERFAKVGHEVAAVIVESYPANAGLILPQPGVSAKARARSRRSTARC